MTDEKAVAFDLEIARLVPEGESLDDHHPLGISVVATFLSGCALPSAWYGGMGGKEPAHRMSAPECRRLVEYLSDLVARGWAIVTWNGLGFDFRVLAEESGLVEECKRLALGHIDLMYHFFCLKGFAIGLQAATEGLGVEGKLEGVSGAHAPRMWAEGRYDEVQEYVGQDVRTTLAVYRALRSSKMFSWITKRGRKSDFGIPGGKLLRVHEAMELPEPDTSWMKPKCRECGNVACPEAVCPDCGSTNIMRPWPRSKFDGWLRYL